MQIQYEPADEYTKTELKNSHRCYSITEHIGKDGTRSIYCWIDGLSEYTEKSFICSKNWLIYLDYVDKTFMIRHLND